MFVSSGSVVVVDGNNMFDNNVAGIKGGEERLEVYFLLMLLFSRRTQSSRHGGHDIIIKGFKSVHKLHYAQI